MSGVDQDRSLHDMEEPENEVNIPNKSPKI